MRYREKEDKNERKRERESLNELKNEKQRNNPSNNNLAKRQKIIQIFKMHTKNYGNGMVKK